MTRGRRQLRALPAILILLTGGLLILSLVGSGSMRDDRLGLVEIEGGRLKWCTREGLIAGTALEPGEYLVFADVSYSTEYRASPPRGWLGLLTDFHTDGEDAETATSVLPLGLPFTASVLAASFVYVLPAARRRARARRNLCPHCAYDLRATPPASPCPECGRAPAHR